MAKMNLWNSETNPIEQGTISSVSGKDGYSATRLRAAGYIRVKPNSTCTFNSNLAKIFIVPFNANKEVISGKSSGWKNTPFEWNTPDGCEYIRLTFANNNDSTISVADFEWLEVIGESSGKKFTRLFLGAIAHTSNGKRFRKLQTEEYVEPTIPTDLRGYKVTVPAGWTCPTDFGSFVVDNNGGGSVIVTRNDEIVYTKDSLYIIGLGYYIYDGDYFFEPNIISFNGDLAFGDKYYTNDCEIQITFPHTADGDVEHPELIQWLYDNNATFEKCVTV